jgi:hypothetical protein
MDRPARHLVEAHRLHRRADVRRALGGPVHRQQARRQAGDPAPVLVHERGRQPDDAGYFLFSAKQDSVGVLQNLFPSFTALYSLYLDIKHRGWNRDRNTH